jgi:hypothetical protein
MGLKDVLQTHGVPLHPEFDERMDIVVSALRRAPGYQKKIDAYKKKKGGAASAAKGSPRAGARPATAGTPASTAVTTRERGRAAKGATADPARRAVPRVRPDPGHHHPAPLGHQCPTHPEAEPGAPPTHSPAYCRTEGVPEIAGSVGPAGLTAVLVPASCRRDPQSWRAILPAFFGVRDVTTLGYWY